MGLNIFAFSLFAAFVFVAKSECLVASQIHDARSIPDAALIMELLELTPIPTPMPTMPPTASTTEVLTANPTANPTATPTKKPPTIKPTAKPTITKRHAIGTVNQNFKFSYVRHNMTQKSYDLLYIARDVITVALRLNTSETVLISSLDPIETTAPPQKQNLTAIYTLTYRVLSTGILTEEELERKAMIAATVGDYNKAILDYRFGYRIESDGLPTFFISGAPTSAPIASTSTVNVLKSSYWAITVLAVIPILCVAFACYAGYRCRKTPKRYIMDRSDDPEGADYMYPPI